MNTAKAGRGPLEGRLEAGRGSVVEAGEGSSGLRGRGWILSPIRPFVRFLFGKHSPASYADGTLVDAQEPSRLESEAKGRGPAALRALAEAMAGRTDRARANRSEDLEPVQTPWGPLERGVLHEWFAPTPPLCLLAGMAGLAVEPLREDESPEATGHVAWIGRRMWPHPRTLVAFDPRGKADDTLLRRSLFLDPPDDGTRHWAIDLALKCEAIACVVADGRGLDMAGSRRLQLAAKEGRALALMARPEREIKVHSAAATRWRVQPTPSPTKHPRWRVELLRRKGLRPLVQGSVVHSPTSQGTWTVQWHGEKDRLAALALVVDRSDSAPDEGTRDLSFQSKDRGQDRAEDRDELRPTG